MGWCPHLRRERWTWSDLGSEASTGLMGEGGDPSMELLQLTGGLVQVLGNTVLVNPGILGPVGKGGRPREGCLKG